MRVACDFLPPGAPINTKHVPRERHSRKEEIVNAKEMLWGPEVSEIPAMKLAHGAHLPRLGEGYVFFLVIGRPLRWRRRRPMPIYAPWGM